MCKEAGVLASYSLEKKPGFGFVTLIALELSHMGCATVVFYLVTAYRNMLDELERRPEVLVAEQPQQEDAFVDEWMRTKE